jgi:hypothetical protein
MEIRKEEERYRRKVSVVLIITIILLVILVGLLIYESQTANPQLSAYSTDWNDLSQFKDEMENYEGSPLSVRTVISSPALLDNIDDPSDSVYVAIGVEKMYLDNEAIAIRKFVERGGSIVIADDFGHGNSVSKQFGVEFLEGRLWDEQYVKNPKFVMVTVDEAPFPFSGAIMFNEPSALKSGSAEKIAFSSEHSWLDKNQNGQRDIIRDNSGRVVDMEGFQIYDLAAVRLVGSEETGGKAVFISDSGLFINDMLDRKDNLEFIQALFDYLLPAGGEIILDEGRHDDQNVLTNIQQESFHIIVIATTNNNFKLLTGVVVFLAMVIILVALSDPPELEHKQRLFKPNLDELTTNFVGPRDQERIRRILVEKIRLTRGYSVDEFKAMSLSDLEDILDDDVLMDFLILKSHRYSAEELRAVLQLIKEWGEEDVE